MPDLQLILRMDGTLHAFRQKIIEKQANPTSQQVLGTKIVGFSQTSTQTKMSALARSIDLQGRWTHFHLQGRWTHFHLQGRENQLFLSLGPS